MWLLVAVALGQDLDDRQRFNDALLDEAAYGDLQRAIAEYDELAKRLPADDPLRGEVIFALGRAHWTLDDALTARRWLLEGIRTGSCPTRCRDLLERVELEREQVSDLPVRWTFEQGSPDHALFHPWRFQDRGSMRVSNAGTLVWTTTPNRRQPDRLTMGFGEVGPVTSLTIKVASVTRDAALQLVVVNLDDQRFGLREALRVPSGRPFAATVRPEEFVPVENGTGTLDAASFAELWLVDITDEGAQLVIDLDELVVR